MTTYYPDTITAIATPNQNGAIGIIRLSGPRSVEALNSVFIKHNKKIDDNIPRHFYLGRLQGKAGVLVDHAMAVYMPEPHSYTGEDIVEIHCHGNQIILRSIIDTLLRLPQTLEIRAAEPGEFTKRAFLNGKMDLTQAEAVHEIITATSDQALRVSLSNLDGYLSEIARNVRQELCKALALVEAGFEFSDQEDIQTYGAADLNSRLERIRFSLAELSKAYQTSRLYDHGVSVAIIGPPNVGKSSLLNALLVEDRAIVTSSPGTTRDVVEGVRVINGIRFIFNDTAGIRDTDDFIEAEGVRRALNLAKSADIVLDLFEPSTNIPRIHFLKEKHQIYLKILTKIDLLSDHKGDSTRLNQDERFDCLISSTTKQGLAILEKMLIERMNVHYSVHNNVHINQRQRDKIEAAMHNLNKIVGLIQLPAQNDEIVAEELRATIYFIDEITGSITTDDVLSEIFGRFCLGK